MLHYQFGNWKYAWNVISFSAQSFLNYVLLCLVFTTTLACRPGEGGLLCVLKQRGWKYFFIAVADVEANYLVVQAYQYTTLTSVQLLDCFTIPVVLLLSWAVLKVRYQIIHIIGVSVCLMGIGCLVWADADENNEPAKNRLLGNFILLLIILLMNVGIFLWNIQVIWCVWEGHSCMVYLMLLKNLLWKRLTVWNFWPWLDCLAVSSTEFSCKLIQK